MSDQILSREDAELRDLVIKAQGSMRAAKQAVKEAIADRIVVGARLALRHKEIDHGRWKSWLETVLSVEGFGYDTALRWMKLAAFAETHADRLDEAATVRQAYILAGILPEPESSGGGSDSGSGSDAYLTYLVRSATHISARLSQRPITEWPSEERKVLRERLAPLVKVYEQLCAA